MAALVHAEPRVHPVLQYAGATYLLYLAWRTAWADAGNGAIARAKPISFAEAVRKVFNWTMAGLLVLSLLPVFW